MAELQKERPCTDVEMLGVQLKQAKPEIPDSQGTDSVKHSGEQPTPSSSRSSLGPSEQMKELYKLQAEMREVNASLASIKTGIDELDVLMQRREEAGRSLDMSLAINKAGLICLIGPEMVRALQDYMRKEALLYLDVPEDECSDKVTKWQHTWCNLCPAKKEKLRIHFGQDIFVFIQLDPSNPDIPDYGPGNHVVSKSATPADRNFLLSVIDNLITTEARQGASASYNWIYNAT